MIEVEQKFRVTDEAKLRSELVAAGFSQQDTVTQVDLYFQHPVRNFAETDEALRLRRDGQHWAVTYKGPRQPGPCKQRFELELPIVAAPETEQQWTVFLEQLGFAPVATVRKQREIWCSSQHPGFCVTIDALERELETPVFCELEVVVPAESTVAAVTRIESMARQLSLSEVEKRSYLEMILSGT